MLPDAQTAAENLQSIFPDTQGRAHNLFFSFPEQKTASITHVASAALAMIDTH